MAAWDDLIALYSRLTVSRRSWNCDKMRSGSWIKELTTVPCMKGNRNLSNMHAVERPEKEFSICLHEVWRKRPNPLVLANSYGI